MTVPPDAIGLVPLLAAVLVPYLGSALWVFRDARRRGSDRATLLGVAILVAAPVYPLAVGLYLLRRPEAEESAPEPSRLDDLLANVTVASAVAFVLATYASPPDPHSQARTAAVALPLLVGLAIVLTYRDLLGGDR